VSHLAAQVVVPELVGRDAEFACSHAPGFPVSSGSMLR